MALALAAHTFSGFLGNEAVQLFLTALLAVAAGLGPVLIWLWVWEHEDKHPEPTKLVIYAFLGGLAAVAIALPLEALGSHFFKSTPLIILIWAAIEEGVKYVAAYTTTLWRAENHEPIDGMMYMIITALGFSALENSLFVITPLLHGDLHLAFALGVNRFFGASVIHIICSGIVGYALAAGFDELPGRKTFYTALGLCTAIALHAALNLSILYSIGGSEAGALYIIWFGVIALVLLFERVKHFEETIKQS